MKKLPVLNIIIFLLFSLFILFSQFTPAYSNTEDELEKEIKETQEAIEENESKLNSIEARIKEISESNYTVSQKINLLNEEISKVEEDITAKENEIKEKLEEIAAKEKILEEKKDLLASVSDRLYRESRVGSIEFFFSTGRIDSLIQSFFVKSSAISLLKDEITEITGEFQNLTVLKQSLEDEKEELDKQKKDLDDSHSLLIAERNKLQRELNEKYNSRELVKRTINGLKSELTDLQYHLLVVRQGGINVNINSVPSGGDYNGSLAGFRENAPDGYFQVFSIGAYTHRNGMSQWGARARADSGQNYKQILNAYYPGKSIRSGTVNIDGKVENIMKDIKTTAYGTLNFEDDYLLRLGEMPEYFHMEALKAQAIAARTYAVNYTHNGDKTICVDEGCQVVGSTKKTGAWADAVKATKGMILTDSSGKPFSTQYAALHGGWSNTAGWDTTDGTGNGDWMARAYDSISGVSWFYKSWYRTGYSNTSSRCGRYPWLSPVELADIVNAAQVLKQTGGDSRIVPIYDACHSEGNPYSHSELRKLADKGASSVSAVVTSSSNGSTQAITFYTDVGRISMSGNEFKTAYNLRAPGHLRIPQNGFVHINIEKK
jgi:peptidoglycan hydrolase CwlO-like protein